MVLIVMNFVGAGVQETFQKDAVAGGGAAIDTVSVYVCSTDQAGSEYLCRAGALQQDDIDACRHQRTGNDDAGNRAGIFPAQQISSLWSYEVWMFGGTLFFIGLAAFFFYVYGSRKAKNVGAGVTPVQPSEARQ